MRNSETLPDDYEFQSIVECARYGGVCRQAITSAIDKGRLKSRKEGGRIKITVGDYNSYRLTKFDRCFTKYNGQLLFSEKEGRYSVNKAAEILTSRLQRTVIPAKVYYEIRIGQLKATRANGYYLITEEDLNEYLKSQGAVSTRSALEQ